MTDQLFRGIEFLPQATPVKQLFILLHGVGASSEDLTPLAHKLRTAFPDAALLLPEKAPELTTLHLLHGESDPVIPVAHAHAGYARLMELNGDATLDVAPSVGHEIHASLAERAIQRLQTCIPLRSWKKVLEGV